MAFIEVSDKLKAQLEAVVADGRAQSVTELVELAVSEIFYGSVTLTAKGFEHIQRAIAEADAGHYIEITTKEEHDEFWERIRTEAEDVEKTEEH